MTRAVLRDERRGQGRLMGISANTWRRCFWVIQLCQLVRKERLTIPLGLDAAITDVVHQDIMPHHCGIDSAERYRLMRHWRKTANL